MLIVPMEAADLSQVAKLAFQLGYPTELTVLERRFRSLENVSTQALLVAKDAERIVGWIQIHTEPISLLSPARVEIAALVVDEASRGQGVGKALLHKAEDWARANRYELVRVESQMKREDAHRFYLREGYQLAKTSKIFTKELDA